MSLPESPTRRFSSRQLAVLVSLGIGLAAAAVFLAVGVTYFARPSATVDPNVVAESIRRGDALVAEGKYYRAIDAYRPAVDASPLDGRLREKLARAYMLATNWRAASREAVRAADLLPTEADVHVLAASLVLREGRFVDAADRMKLVLSKDPKNVAARIVLGNATAQLRSSTWALERLPDLTRSRDEALALDGLRPTTTSSDDRAAEEAFRKALDLAPTSTDAKLALVNFLWATGRRGEGEPMLRALADATPEHAIISQALGWSYLSHHQGADAEPYLKRAAESPVDGRGARMTLADYYVETDRDADAVSLLTGSPGSDDATGDVSLRLARIWLRTGQHGASLRRLDAFLGRQPRDAQAVELKVQILLAKKDFDQALAVARDAVSGDPASSSARHTLADALFAVGDLESAFDEEMEGLRLDPRQRRDEQLLQLSMALERGKDAVFYAQEIARRTPADREAATDVVKALILGGDYTAAEQALQPLLARDPKSPQLLVQLGRIQAGSFRPEAARATFTRALEVDPGSLDALSGIISLDLGERRIADARRRVEGAREAHARDPRYLSLAARVYIEANNASRAESVLRRAVEIDQAAIEPALALARLFREQRRFDEAKQVLERVLQRRPRSEQARSALALAVR